MKGTLRWRGRLDWALDQRIHIGLSQVQPWIKNVLRLGAYQLMFLDRVPVHAAVDESVKLAHKYGHPGTAGLVNSVLRRLADEKDTIEFPAGDDVGVARDLGLAPTLDGRALARRASASTSRARCMLANNRPARLGLRANRLRGTRQELIERLAREERRGHAGRALARPRVGRTGAITRRARPRSATARAPRRTRARRSSGICSRRRRTSGCSICARRRAASARTSPR